MLGWFKGLSLGYRLAVVAGTLLAIMLLVTWCYTAVTHAYDSIYQGGFKAGAADERSKTQDAIIAHQAKQLQLQQQITTLTDKYSGLYTQYTLLEQSSPEKVIRYVEKDPAFAQSQRPADLQSLRVSELQSLRQTAATH